MSFVLDTNIVVAALNGHPPVVERLNSIPAGHDRALHDGSIGSLAVENWVNHAR